MERQRQTHTHTQMETETETDRGSDGPAKARRKATERLIWESRRSIYVSKDNVKETERQQD